MPQMMPMLWIFSFFIIFISFIFIISLMNFIFIPSILSLSVQKKSSFWYWLW